MPLTLAKPIASSLGYLSSAYEGRHTCDADRVFMHREPLSVTVVAMKKGLLDALDPRKTRS
jgi:hypothetical protein